MSSHEAAPPPYPGASEQMTSNVITAKGEYKGVPIYEVGSAPSPICTFESLGEKWMETRNIVELFLDAPTTYQPVPVLVENSAAFPGRSIQIGRHPVHCVCPQCHQQIVTYVNYVRATRDEKQLDIHSDLGIGSIRLADVFTVDRCWVKSHFTSNRFEMKFRFSCIPCCVIPFCVSSCQDATHVCPHCSAVIGRHRVL